MRRFPAVQCISVAVLAFCSAPLLRADSISLSPGAGHGPTGPNFLFAAIHQNHLTIAGDEFLNYQWQSSNTQKILAAGVSYFAIDTGPLISNTATSWMFEGGGALLGSWETVPADAGPIPDGFDSCEAAGLGTWEGPGSGPCVARWSVTGNLIGNSVLRLVDMSSDAPVRFSFSSLASFEINTQLATYLRVSTGPYSGGVEISGVAEMREGVYPFFFEPDRIELTGAVPEPSSYLLLSSALLAIGILMRKRSLA